MDAHWEPLGRQLKVLAAKGCGFSTDTLLLADFSMPKRNSACADLGSGCGVIPLLWGSRAKPKSILALDVQGEALELMRASVKENGMEGLITPVQGDIRDYRRVLPHQALDLAASNPPYFPPGSGAVSRDPQRVQQRPGREPYLLLLECRKGGGPGLSVQENLFITDSSGGYSQEMRRIYGDYLTDENSGKEQEDA